MKKALVCGAGGFIAGHLVKKLKKEGYWVRGVNIKEHEFASTQADEFLLLDLRKEENFQDTMSLNEGRFNEVYQLAVDMGGMGFIHSGECEIMHNSALINIVNSTCKCNFEGRQRCKRLNRSSIYTNDMYLTQDLAFLEADCAELDPRWAIAEDGLRTLKICNAA